MHAKQHKPIRLLKDPFAYVVMWQFLTFIMFILIIWINELEDISAVLFNTPPQDANIFRGCLLTAGALLVAIVSIGTTYLQQKRVYSSIISICAKCNKVRINPTQWKEIAAFLSDNSPMSFTHGLCPDCMEEVMQAIDKRTAMKNED